MNELAKRFAETTQPRVERLLLTALGGILLGCFVLLIVQLPQKFIYFLVGGPVILLVAIASGRFKRFFQGLLIFIIPLNYSTHFFRRPYKFDTTTGLDFSPLDIILIVLYAIWIYELVFKKSNRIHFLPKFTIPAFCLVGISALSMIPAADPYLTLFATVRIFKAVLLAFYIANHFQSKKDISFALVLLLGGLFLQSMIAFSQKWLGISLGLHLFGEYREMLTVPLAGDYNVDVSRVGGTIGHPNGLAKYVELLLPLTVVMLFTEIKLKTKLVAGLIFVCAFVVLLLTLSRGGWTCFAGSIVLVFLLIFRARLISLRSLFVIAVVIVLLGSAMVSFSGMVQARLISDDYGAARGRIPLNRLAFAVIRANPYLGVGNLNLWKVRYLYNPNLVGMKAEQVIHNAYLAVAAEMGIPGLLIFIWLLASIFLQGLGNLKKKDTFLICVSIGILGGMAALWAHWLVDPAYIGREAFLWVLVGLLLASKKAPVK